MKEFIPQTSIEHYITGHSALNIHSLEGTGDWHTLSVFHGAFGRKPSPIIISGVNNYPSSFKWLGESELIDCRDFLINQKVSFADKDHPVWASTHYRAVVDYVIYLVEREKDLSKSVELDAWLPERNEKEQCFNLLHIINDADGFTSKQWFNISSWMNQQIILHHS